MSKTKAGQPAFSFSSFYLSWLPPISRGQSICRSSMQSRLAGEDSDEDFDWWRRGVRPTYKLWSFCVQKTAAVFFSRENKQLAILLEKEVCSVKVWCLSTGWPLCLYAVLSTLLLYVDWECKCIRFSLDIFSHGLQSGLTSSLCLGSFINFLSVCFCFSVFWGFFCGPVTSYFLLRTIHSRRTCSIWKSDTCLLSYHLQS